MALFPNFKVSLRSMFAQCNNVCIYFVVADPSLCQIHATTNVFKPKVSEPVQVMYITIIKVGSC